MDGSAISVSFQVKMGAGGPSRASRSTQNLVLPNPLSSGDFDCIEMGITGVNSIPTFDHHGSPVTASPAALYDPALCQGSYGISFRHRKINPFYG